jgi:hypothetical protein
MSLTGSDPFLDRLIDTADTDPRVVGLVLAGSSAEPERRDRWSDHDFLLVTADGTPEEYRTDLSWLPFADDIGFWFRETAHGLKVLYRSGLIIEFAVFDRSEFAGCALNHYAVAVDHGGITDLAAQVADRSLAPSALDQTATWRHVLSLVYIGTGRARRGERLSANVLIRDYATAHLLRLVHSLLSPDERRQLDELDPWRRIELAVPDLAGRIDDALSGPVDAAGLALLSCADPFLRDRWADYPQADTDLVVRLLSI